MTDTANEPAGGGTMTPAELAAGVVAIIRETAGRRPNGDNWAAIRERAEANLSPAELAAAREAVREELRNRGW